MTPDRHQRFAWLVWTACFGMASVAVAADDDDRVPHLEAINLVAAYEGQNLEKLDGGDWWLDTQERSWTVTRQIGPGVLDTAHSLVVSYIVAGEVRKSWAVDLRKKRVVRLPGGTAPLPPRAARQPAPVPVPAPAPALDQAAEVLAEQSGKPVRPWSTRDFGRERFDGARSVLIAEGKAKVVLSRVRKRLPAGLVAFIGTQRSLATPAPDGVEVVVGPGKTQFEILRIAASDAVNYGMETEALITKLQSWDAAYGIDIFQAETDTIQLRLKSMPKDLRKFAQEVYAFCPDIVDQGTGSVDELAAEILRTRGVFLWWD